MTDVANGTDKLLYVDQLVNILQACKERYRTSGSGGSDHLFDSSDYMRFTAFVDDTITRRARPILRKRP